MRGINEPTAVWEDFMSRRAARARHRRQTCNTLRAIARKTAAVARVTVTMVVIYIITFIVAAM